MIKFADTTSKAARALKPLAALWKRGELEYVEIDTETFNNQGLPASDAFTSVLRTTQLNWGDGPVVLDLLGIRPDSAVIKLIKAILADARVIKYAHNASFEYRFFRVHLGVRTQNLWDTMLAAKNLGRGALAFGYDLASVLYRESGGTIELEKETRKSDWSVTELTKRQVIYAGRDVKHLRWLGEKQRTELEVWPRQARINKLEMDLLPVFAEMELVGVRMNRAKIQEVRKRFADEVAERLHEIQTLMPWVPVPKSSLRKHHQVDGVKVLLYPDGVRPVENGNDFKNALRAMNIAIPTLRDKKTNRYRESLSMGTYTQVKDPVPGRNIGHKLKDWAEQNATLTKYLNQMEGWIHPVTNRVHYSVNQILVTGRISVSEPPLQQMPKEAWFREIFIPKKGYSWLKLDYSQLELRLMAYRSQDRNMLSEYSKGMSADIHTKTAQSIYNTRTPTKEQRNNSKPVNFGCLYGQYSNGLQVYCRKDGLEFSLDECDTFIKGFFTAYPGIKRYHEEIRQAVLACFQAGKEYVGYTLAGRQRVWDYEALKRQCSLRTNRYGKNYWSVNANEEINTPIQGTGGDGMKIAMLRVAEHLRTEFPKARVILQVHDELDIEAPTNQVEAVAIAVARIMEESMSILVQPTKRFPQSVPIYVEAGIGDSWGTCKPYELPR